MSTSKIIAIIAASSMLGMFAAAPAFAESIPQEEIDQYDGSAKPDVDPGASRGPDESIVDQEQNQFGNAPAKDLGPEMQEGGGQSLPQLEQEGVPGGDR
ncbi:MAG: hypothetical protein WC829_11950 [Hyphomicrobium sp.]|jgi:hypothetical protein